MLAELSRADAILYGMGSLYTSIAPSLVLKGVGECIAAADVPKVGAALYAVHRSTVKCSLNGCFAVIDFIPPPATSSPSRHPHHPAPTHPHPPTRRRSSCSTAGWTARPRVPSPPTPAP